MQLIPLITADPATSCNPAYTAASCNSADPTAGSTTLLIPLLTRYTAGSLSPHLA